MYSPLLRSNKYMTLFLVYSCSLKALHNIIFTGFQHEKNARQSFGDAFWQYDHEVVHAVWTLVRMASSDATNSLGTFVSDFLSMVSLLSSFHFPLFFLHYVMPLREHQVIKNSFLLTCAPDRHWGSTSRCFPSSWRFKSDTCVSASLF